MYVPCFIYQDLDQQYITYTLLTCRLTHTQSNTKAAAATNVTAWSESASCVAECFGSAAVRLNFGEPEHAAQMCAEVSALSG